MNFALRTSFTTFAKDKIGPLALNTLAKTSDNPYYEAAGPYLARIEKSLNEYTPAAAVKNPTPAQTAEMRQLRDVLNRDLTALAKYANGLYPTNEAALLSTGLSLTKERKRHTTLLPPKKYSLHDGTEADTLCAKMVRADYAVATEVRYTDTPALPWYDWKSVVTTGSSALLRGYKKKTEVFVMFRSIGGDTDDQEFSEVLSRIVQ